MKYLKRSLTRRNEALIILKSYAFTLEGLVELTYDRRAVKTNTGVTVKSPRSYTTHIGQGSIYPTPLKYRNGINQFSNLRGKFTVNCISIYKCSECAHTRAEAVHVYTQRLHNFTAVSEWSQMQNKAEHIPTAVGGMNTCSHSAVSSTQIAYCNPHLMGWIGSNAGFQQQFELEIQSGGRTMSTAHSATQTKGLHSELTNQETPPRISIVPVHMNIKAPKVGNGSHCSLTVQQVSAPCTLVIRKIK